MSGSVERLSHGQDVRNVLRRGRRRAGRLLVLHVHERHDDLPGRVAVVASKRVGNAVARNRAKRVLREAARCVGVADGVDVALVARAGAQDVKMQAVHAELLQLTAGGPLGPAVGAPRRASGRA